MLTACMATQSLIRTRRRKYVLFSSLRFQGIPSKIRKEHPVTDVDVRLVRSHTIRFSSQARLLRVLEINIRSSGESIGDILPVTAFIAKYLFIELRWQET